MSRLSVSQKRLAAVFEKMTEVVGTLADEDCDALVEACGAALERSRRASSGPDFSKMSLTELFEAVAKKPRTGDDEEN